MSTAQRNRDHAGMHHVLASPVLLRVLATAAWGALIGPAALAQSADPAAPPPIGYAHVDAALQDLTAQDGQGTVVAHVDGWTIVNQPMAAAQWSFTPPGHPAHPAVVRRTIVRGPNRAVTVDTGLLCEGPASACEQLKTEFTAMNDRIAQAVKARAGAPR